MLYDLAADGLLTLFSFGFRRAHKIGLRMNILEMIPNLPFHLVVEPYNCHQRKVLAHYST